MTGPPRRPPLPPDLMRARGLVTDLPGSRTWWCEPCRRWTMPSRRHPDAHPDSCDQCEEPRERAA